jgi:uncharacterized protein (DUF1697 family)
MAKANRAAALPDRRVALLRGVNVGTAKRVAMDDLQTLFVSLGYRDVRTILNSGNVVFTVVKPGAGGAAARIERAIAARLGVSTSVLVLTAKDVAEGLRGNPFTDTATNPSRLLLLWLRDAKAAAAVKALADRSWKPEALVVKGRMAYLWCAAGIAAGRLWTEINRVVGAAGTARNLATMTKILARLEV